MSEVCFALGFRLCVDIAFFVRSELTFYVQVRYCRWFVFVFLIGMCYWLSGLSSDTAGCRFGTGFVMFAVVSGMVFCVVIW